MLETRSSVSILQPLHQVDVTQITYYAKVDLDQSVDDALFVFAVPQDAIQVRRLFVNDHNIELKGLPAPPLKLKTLDGNAFDSNSLKGRTVLVDFWASWCVPCVQQMRSLAKLEENLVKQGLVVIGINWGDEDPDVARRFIAKNGFGWTHLRADNETTTAWLLNGVPLVAIIDPHGNIAYYHTGYEEPEESAIMNALREIDPRFSLASNTGQR